MTPTMKTVELPHAWKDDESPTECTIYEEDGMASVAFYSASTTTRVHTTREGLRRLVRAEEVVLDATTPAPVRDYSGDRGPRPGNSEWLAGVFREDMKRAERRGWSWNGLVRLSLPAQNTRPF